MSFTNTTQVNAEHQEWLKGLDFYKEDIHILENRLTKSPLRIPHLKHARGSNIFRISSLCSGIILMSCDIRSKNTSMNSKNCNWLLKWLKMKNWPNTRT